MPHTTVAVKVDAMQAAEELRAVVAEVSSDVSYELQSAIENTAHMLQNCPRPYVFARLASHLDQLLAQQLRLVSPEPLPVIE